MTRFLAVAAALLAAGGSARATTLTFDDAIAPWDQGPIPNGYGGFNWDNFYAGAPVALGLVPSGYLNGMVSPDYIAANGGGDPASVAISSAAEFDFDGCWLTGAWNDGLSINARGYRGGALLYDRTVVATFYAPTWFDFDFQGVDTLVFSSFGGTPVSGTNGSGTHFAMDNFTFNERTVVPEPLTAMGLAAGVGLLGAYLRRR